MGFNFFSFTILRFGSSRGCIVWYQPLVETHNRQSLSKSPLFCPHFYFNSYSSLLGRWIWEIINVQALISPPPQKKESVCSSQNDSWNTMGEEKRKEKKKEAETIKEVISDARFDDKVRPNL